MALANIEFLLTGLPLPMVFPIRKSRKVSTSFVDLASFANACKSPQVVFDKCRISVLVASIRSSNTITRLADSRSLACGGLDRLPDWAFDSVTGTPDNQ